ncbi:MAG: ABC transporter permease [Paludibacteraceae bacterium]|nr:ABC transporter permease [Paludibacteraceae bacterium]
MLKFNLLLALRRLLRNKLYTAISVVSISIAFAIVLFLLNFVVHEIKTDQFHENKEQIERVLSKFGDDKYETRTPPPLAPALKKKYPAVVNYACIWSMYFEEQVNVKSGDIAATEKIITYANQSLFDIFTFPILQGSFDNLDKISNAIVISESKARKYFGNSNPIDQILTFEYYNFEAKKTVKDFQVVAVMKDIPSTSTIKTDFITNRSELTDNEWGSYSAETYLKLLPGTDREELTKQIAETIFSNYDHQFSDKPEYENWALQPLTEIHLYSDHIQGGSSGSLNFVKILIALSILIISVAFLNYLLLNTSLSFKHHHTHKILNFNGAGKLDIFAKESIYCLLQITFSLLVAIPLAKIIHQYFGSFLGDQQFVLYNNALLVFGIIIFCVLTGFTLAFFIHRFFSKSFQYYQHKKAKTISSQSLASYFIVGQIIIFTGLLMSSFILIKQMHFIQQKDPGCNLNNTMAFAMNTRDFPKTKVIKQEALKNSFITNISHGESLPHFRKDLKKITIDGNPDHTINAQILQGDSEFTNVYEIPIVAGRNLDPTIQPNTFFEFHQVNENTPIEILVNESFAKQLHKDEVLCTILQGSGFCSGVIVGIVKDFHAESYYAPIKPTIIAYSLYFVTSTFLVKFQPGHLADTEKYIGELYSQFFPNIIYDKWHYNQNETYKKDINRTRLISGLTLVTILISMLGFIGWSLLSTENKTKEIGIRKVNGAKIWDVMFLLNQDFIKWTIVAFIIATPISYHVMHKWLENFAYKTELSWWIFALAGLLALGIALLTVSWQSWRAATRNPVEALRYE